MPKIRKQTWIETDNFIQITLYQPMWSGWKVYNWLDSWGQVEGLGISEEAVRYGFKVNKKIRVVVLKYGKYEISPHMAMRRAKELNSRFTARDGKVLLVIPRTAFRKIEPKQPDEKKETIRINSIHKTEALQLV